MANNRTKRLESHWWGRRRTIKQENI